MHHYLNLRTIKTIRFKINLLKNGVIRIMKQFPAEADALFKTSQADAKRRIDGYKRLAAMDFSTEE